MPRTVLVEGFFELPPTAKVAVLLSAPPEASVDVLPDEWLESELALQPVTSKNSVIVVISPRLR